jgi:hypothetical protein
MSANFRLGFFLIFPKGYPHKDKKNMGLLFAEGPLRLRFHLEALPLALQTIP